MTRHSLSLVLLACSLAALGCDSKGGAAADDAKGATTAEAKAEGKAAGDAKTAEAAKKVASCNLIKSESLCREYGDANIEAGGEDFIKGLCSGGEFKMEPCPGEKRVGSCVTPEGTKIFYSEGPLPLSADDAGKQCKEGVPAGEWKAGQ